MPQSSKPQIFNLGVNFKSSNVGFRESLYIPEDQLEKKLTEIKNQFSLDEIAVLSTCNRFEMFGVKQSEEPCEKTLLDIFIAFQGDKNIERNELVENTYIYRNSSAVHHLISVASSLDSLVVGETQITGQFKKAVALAKEASSLGPVLDRLCQEALSCSKKIRRNTAIGEKTVSISHAAIDLAKKIFGEISQQKIVIIGAGEMSRLAYKYAASYKPKLLAVVNRTLENADKLVEEVGYGSAYCMDSLEVLLEEADIVISSTSSSSYIISKDKLSSIVSRKKNSSMFLCDIAIPRDIEPECREIDEVFLFEVDDLQQVVNENIEERKLAAKDALKYVDSATRHYIDWVSSHDLKPILASVKESLDSFLHKESSKTLKKDIFSGLSEDQITALTDLREAIASKLLAQIAKTIGKEQDEDQKHALVHAVKKLYLDDNSQ